MVIRSVEDILRFLAKSEEKASSVPDSLLSSVGLRSLDSFEQGIRRHEERLGLSNQDRARVEAALSRTREAYSRLRARIVRLGTHTLTSHNPSARLVPVAALRARQRRTDPRAGLRDALNNGSPGAIGDYLDRLCGGK